MAATFAQRDMTGNTTTDVGRARTTKTAARNRCFGVQDAGRMTMGNLVALVRMSALRNAGTATAGSER